MPRTRLAQRRQARATHHLVWAGAVIVVGTYAIWPVARYSTQTLSYADASRILVDHTESESRRLNASVQVMAAVRDGASRLSQAQRGSLLLLAQGRRTIQQRPMVLTRWSDETKSGEVFRELEAALSCHHAARWNATSALRENLMSQARWFDRWLRD